MITAKDLDFARSIIKFHIMVCFNLSKLNHKIREEVKCYSYTIRIKPDTEIRQLFLRCLERQTSRLDLNIVKCQQHSNCNWGGSGIWLNCTIGTISSKAVYQSVVTTLHDCRLSSEPFGSVCPDSCIVPTLATTAETVDVWNASATTFPLQAHRAPDSVSNFLT